MIHEPSWIELVDMAREAIDEHRYERAQALAAVTTAAAMMQAVGALAAIAAALDDDDARAALAQTVAIYGSGK